MKVLTICASAKPEGLAVRTLRECLAPVEAAGHQTELVVLPELEIKFCDHCAVCDDAETCPIEDDFWPLYLKMKEADAIVLATPLSFGSVMAMLKAVLERAGRVASVNGLPFRDKRSAMLILEFGDGLETARQQIEAWCRQMRMRSPYAASIDFKGQHSRAAIEAGVEARRRQVDGFAGEIVKLLAGD